MNEAPPPAKPRSRLRSLGRALLIFIAGCSAVVGLLMIFENRFVFFPVRASEDWHEPEQFEKQDVELTLLDETVIHAWWLPKVGAKDALLYAHGNGGNLSHRLRSYELLRKELNVSILAFDYPGYGKSTGSPTESGCYEAGDEAFNWLVTEGRVSPKRVILFGESLGGAIATELAARQPCRALVLFSAFTSAPAVGKEIYPFLPLESMMRNRFDNLSKIVKLKCPVFIAHGDADRMIRPHHAQKLFDAAPEPKRLYWIPGADHNDDMTAGMAAALREFLREHPMDKGSTP